jgi:hypothetical protein
VDLEGIPYGVAAATFKNPVLRLSAQKVWSHWLFGVSLSNLVLSKGIEAIMALNKSAMTLYRDSSNAFKVSRWTLFKSMVVSCGE